MSARLSEPARNSDVKTTGEQTAHWWRHPAVILAAITVAGLIIRLFRLDSLPAEMWGDVSAHEYLANKVMTGDFYFDYEFGGDGPLFSYIAAAVGKVTGLSFFSLKLTGALIGTLLIVAIYFYAETLFHSRRIGYIAAFLTAVSFWTIVMSRQAKPYILVPVFVAAALTLALRRQRILTGMVVGLGMYAQAAFWGMPILLLFMPLALPVAAVVALPFLITFAQNPSSMMGSSSYLGSKIHVASSPVDLALRVLDNLGKNALSFNFSGDTTFRQNISGNPHLDVISGVLFVIGLLLLMVHTIRTRDRRMAIWFLLPFLVLQIPLLADQVPSDTPNIGRLTCLLPMTIAAIAFAVDWLTVQLCRLLNGRVSRSGLVAGGVTGIVLAGITVINLTNYFEVYPRGLPNNNTPFDLVIARDMDRAPPHTTSILLGCCWGDYTQPEPQSVLYRTATGHEPSIASSMATVRHDIRSLAPGTRVALYMDPSRRVPHDLALRQSTEKVLRANGWQVARVITGVYGGPGGGSAGTG